MLQLRLILECVQKLVRMAVPATLALQTISAIARRNSGGIHVKKNDVSIPTYLLHVDFNNFAAIAAVSQQDALGRVNVGRLRNSPTQTSHPPTTTQYVPHNYHF